MTLVSVVIPTYNRNELLLNRSLRSVFKQTHQELQIIIVCDGMAEPDLVELGAHISDQRVTIWNIPRQHYPDDEAERWMVLGLEARNFGLDRATGEWIAPLDDDDEWTNDHVALLLGEAQKRDADFAYGQSLAFWADGTHSMYGNWPPGHFQFCDGAQLYRNGLGYRYDPDCVKRGLPEDGDLWDRMVAGGVRFTFVPEIVHYYYPFRQRET